MYGCRLQSTTAAVTNASDAGDRCWGVPAAVLGFTQFNAPSHTADNLAPAAQSCQIRQTDRAAWVLVAF